MAESRNAPRRVSRLWPMMPTHFGLRKRARRGRPFLRGTAMIPGIWIAAAITFLVSLGVVGGMLLALSPRAERGTLLLIIVLQLPMSALAFYGIRLPIKHAIENHVDAET